MNFSAKMQWELLDYGTPLCAHFNQSQEEDRLLTDAQLEDFRQRVEGELAAVNMSLSLPDGAEAPFVLDQSRVGRLSRMDAMQQQAMALGIKSRLQLRKRRLEAARERIDSGEYGICCACGGDMPMQRMLADLGAPFCTTCQNDIDARR